MVTTTYHSPLGEIELTADADGLVRLLFVERSESRREATVLALADGESGRVPNVRVVPANRDDAAPDAAAGGPHEQYVGPRDTAALGVLERAWAWLNAYFAGHEPQFLPPLNLGGTAFQREVWACLVSVGRGETASLSELAARVARRRQRAGDARRVTAAAVSGAVAKNPVPLVLPCHRVLDASGRPVGSGRVAARRARLLAFERGEGR